MGNTGTGGPPLVSPQGWSQPLWDPTYDCFNATQAIMAYAGYNASFFEHRFVTLVVRDGDNLAWTGTVDLGSEYTSYRSSTVYTSCLALTATSALVAWFQYNRAAASPSVPTLALITRSGTTLTVDQVTSFDLGGGDAAFGYHFDSEGTGLWLTKVDDTHALVVASVDSNAATNYSMPAVRLVTVSGAAFTMGPLETFSADPRRDGDDSWPTAVVLGDGHRFQMSFHNRTVDNFYARNVVTGDLDLTTGAVSWGASAVLDRSDLDYVNNPPEGVLLDDDPNTVAWVHSGSDYVCHPVAGHFLDGIAVRCVTSASLAQTLGSAFIIDGAFDPTQSQFSGPQPWKPYIVGLGGGRYFISWERGQFWIPADNPIQTKLFPLAPAGQNHYDQYSTQYAYIVKDTSLCGWHLESWGDMYLTGPGYYIFPTLQKPRLWPTTQKLWLAGETGLGNYGGAMISQDGNFTEWIAPGTSAFEYDDWTAPAGNPDGPHNPGDNNDHNGIAAFMFPITEKVLTAKTGPVRLWKDRG